MLIQRRSGEVSITHYQALNFKESGTITGRHRSIETQENWIATKLEVHSLVALKKKSSIKTSIF